MSDVEPTLESGIDRASDDHETVIDLRDASSLSSVPNGGEPVDGLRRRRLFGLDLVDAPSLEPVLTSLLQRRRPLDRTKMETVLTPNADIMVHLTRPDAEHSVEWMMFQRSQYCLPDGQPLVLTSRLLGVPLRGRLTGSGLFALLWPRLVTDRRSVFMVASSALIVERLEAEYPLLRSVVAPMFEPDDVETIEQLAQAVISAAGEKRLEYLVLGVGNPKDARIAECVLRLWPSGLGRPPTVLALGGAASMYVGLTRRAPEWVQRIGMEWFFRFVQEPRRLFYRYFIRDLAFVRLVWQEWRANRRSLVPPEGQASWRP